MWKFKLFVLFWLIMPIHSALQNNMNILVLVDHFATIETHSIFFKSLGQRGYNLTYKMADDSRLELTDYGVYLYKHLIIFAPSVEYFGGKMNLHALTEFVDDGGNVLVTGGVSSGWILREFAAECGLELDYENRNVIDHLNYDITDAGAHTSILTKTNNLIPIDVVFERKLRSIDVAPLIYQGTALIVRHQANNIILNILTAEHTAYCYETNQPMDERPLLVGSDTVLIAGLQAKNNARVVYTGSLNFFSNEAFSQHISYAGKETMQYANSSNKAVAMALAAWTFGERGYLRIGEIKHHKLGEKPQSNVLYTIKDWIVYEITLEELLNDKWLPYVTNETLQLEFVLFNPYVRGALKSTKPGTYRTQFRIPDLYGIYQFKFKHARPGYTTISQNTQIVVRPMRHDQYERFIISAYPYYASALSMMVGLFVFSFVYIHMQEPEKSESQTNLNKQATKYSTQNVRTFAKVQQKKFK